MYISCSVQNTVVTILFFLETFSGRRRRLWTDGRGQGKLVWSQATLRFNSSLGFCNWICTKKINLWTYIYVCPYMFEFILVQETVSMFGCVKIELWCAIEETSNYSNIYCICDLSVSVDINNIVIKTWPDKKQHPLCLFTIDRSRSSTWEVWSLRIVSAIFGHLRAYCHQKKSEKIPNYRENEVGVHTYKYTLYKYSAFNKKDKLNSSTDSFSLSFECFNTHFSYVLSYPDGRLWDLWNWLCVWQHG